MNTEEKTVLLETGEETVVGGAAEDAGSIGPPKCPRCGSTHTFTGKRRTITGSEIWGAACRDCGHTWSLPIHHG